MKYLITIILLALSLNLKGQDLRARHIFSNDGNSDSEIVNIKVRYGKKDACDTLWVGKEIHYILCADWHGWTKGEKRPKNASIGDGYSLCQDVNPKNGRQAFKPINKDWYWFIYLDDWFGHKLIRITHQNFKTNQYTAYLK